MFKKKEIEMVRVSDIEADALQPRKNFSPERLAELVKSIKKHGIMNPVIIESRKGGGYILVDGERRYRAAKELNLTEIPAVIVGAQSEVERLVQQFHLQEQHEGWSAMEKAIAVSRLAKELGIGIQEMAEMLSLPRETVGNYTAFSKLLERSYFEKNEIPISYAKSLITLSEFTKKHYQTKLNKEFTADKGRKLERAVINRIKNGQINKRSDLLKIRDAVKADPKAADRLIEDEKVTPDALFIDSKARVTWLARNVIAIGNNLATHIQSGMALNMQNLFEDDNNAKAVLKLLKTRLDTLINRLP